MSESQCENCSNPLSKTESICQVCEYPQKGTKTEQIAYNNKLIRLKDLLEDSDKSIKGILSFAIIFLFMAIIVLSFSLLFKENHYGIVLVFGIVGLVYFILNRLGKKSSYLMVVLAIFFYLGHTIFEFSYGMFLKSPFAQDNSLFENSGISLFFAIIPLVYLIFRLALMLVLAKYLWIQLMLKRDEKMVQFIRTNKTNDPI